MSEYQYYEFLAIDRPLSIDDVRALRALSSRATITPTSFVNSYDWGDFKGNPGKLIERWFDVHLYFADWGSRRLMLRLPKPALDIDGLARFLDWIDDSADHEVEVDTWVTEKHVVVDIQVNSEGCEWHHDEEEGYLMAMLLPLRAALQSGDLRLFYLLWLIAVDLDIVDGDVLEPMAGIGPLTPELDAFAKFFAINGDLVEAAAQAAPGQSLRTAGELRALAAGLEQARADQRAAAAAAELKRKAAEAERLRRGRLDKLAERGTDACWALVEAGIAKRNPAGYAEAITLITDLKVLAAEQGELTDFASRLDDIRQRQARKGTFITQLAQVI